MGLREWKEKRAKKAERSEMASNVNKTSVQEEKRKVKEKYIMANAQEAEKAKDELIELLRELRRTVNNNPNCFQYEKEITDLITTINHGRNLTNSNIQYAVDLFIKNKVDECFNYIERDNITGLMLTLGQIKELVRDRNDMSSDLSKYTVKQYREVKVQYDTYMIQKRVLEASVKEITNQIEKLKEMGHDPKYKTELKGILDNCKLLDNERTLKQKNIDQLAKNINVLNTTLNSIERNIVLEEIPGFTPIIDTVSDITAQNEETNAKQEMIQEAGNELNKSLQDNNVSESSITVSSGSLESETTESENEDMLNQLDRF